MVWHTSVGDRVLSPLEAEFYLDILFIELKRILSYGGDNFDYIAEFELTDSTGNSFFDRASFNQQIYLINFATKALIREDVPMPELDHLLEAAAYYPFACLISEIEMEIDNQLHTKEELEHEYMYYFREKTWKVFEELFPDDQFCEEDDEYDPIRWKEKSRCRDLSEWEYIVDCLADLIFWDRDWYFVTTNPDYLDGMDEMMRQSLGITENYFTNRLPKVSNEEAIKYFREIIQWKLDYQKKKINYD